MTHNWEYSDDRQERKCLNCLIQEAWEEDCGKWIWLATDEFMDCMIACKEKE